jgi:hypothetical protein
MDNVGCWEKYSNYNNNFYGNNERRICRSVFINYSYSYSYELEMQEQMTLELSKEDLEREEKAKELFTNLVQLKQDNKIIDGQHVLSLLKDFNQTIEVHPESVLQNGCVVEFASKIESN